MLLFDTKNNSFKNYLKINHVITSSNQSKNNFDITTDSSKISLLDTLKNNDDDYSLNIDFYITPTNYPDFDISSNIVTLTLNFSEKYIDLSLNNSSLIDKQVNVNNNSISYFQNETIDQSFSESNDGGIYIKNVLYSLRDISYFNELDDITTTSGDYQIKITTDVCFNSIGRYTISYDVVDITNPDTSNIITRIINVVDEIKPKILFNNNVSN